MNEQYRIIFCIFVILMSGCTPKGLYYWGDYEESLYDRYVENDPQQAYDHLKQTILEAESQKRRVPPGIYADYGFMLFSRGDLAGAITYFRQEQSLYPESTALMAKLISKIEQKQYASSIAPSKTEGVKQ